MRKFIAAALCSMPLAAILLFLLEQTLLDAGILNMKDLYPLVGGETGTISEYFLNVWHYDAVAFLSLLASLPCVVVGVLMLRGKKMRTTGR